jgi:hypothetical protein
MYFLLDTFQKLKETSAQIGLNINEHKKYLRCTKKEHKIDGTDINQTYLKQVKSYKYLRIDREWK